MTDRDRVIVELQGVGQTYGRGPLEVRVLDDVNLSLQRGAMNAISGPSGCGKTTMLNLIGALDKPSEGSVTVDSVDVGSLSGRDQVAYRRKKVGFVFQTFNLLPGLNALENVMLPMEFAGVAKSKRAQRARELLIHAGLPATRLGNRPSQLSGGEQQRVAVARALANDPQLILADEPTGNLDSKAATQVVELLTKLAKEEGRTLIIVTHNPLVAKACDREVQMRDGKIIDPVGV